MDNNPAVTTHLDALNHPLRTEIEALRRLILTTGAPLEEIWKWNGPSYTAAGQDRLTMKIQPPKSIQLIFHRGVQVQTQPPERLIGDPVGLLVWKENDRAVATFKTQAEVEATVGLLPELIRSWVAATSE